MRILELYINQLAHYIDIGKKDVSAEDLLDLATSINQALDKLDERLSPRVEL